MKGTSGALPKVASRDIHFEHPFEKSRVAAVFAQFCCPPFERALAPTQARRSGEVPIQIQIQPPEAIQIQIHGGGGLQIQISRWRGSCPRHPSAASGVFFLRLL